MLYTTTVSYFGDSRFDAPNQLLINVFQDTCQLKAVSKVQATNWKKPRVHAYDLYSTL